MRWPRKICELDYNKIFCANANVWMNLIAIGLYHPRDGVTNPKYKLLHFLTTKLIWKDRKAQAFNRDRYSHLALCLLLILFHWVTKISAEKNVLTSQNLFFCLSLSTWSLVGGLRSFDLDPFYKLFLPSVFISNIIEGDTEKVCTFLKPVLQK